VPQIRPGGAAEPVGRLRRRPALRASGARQRYAASAASIEQGDVPDV